MSDECPRYIFRQGVNINLSDVSEIEIDTG
jgi:hypothetical protein